MAAANTQGDNEKKKEKQNTRKWIELRDKEE